MFSNINLSPVISRFRWFRLQDVVPGDAPGLIMRVSCAKQEVSFYMYDICNDCGRIAMENNAQCGKLTEFPIISFTK